MAVKKAWFEKLADKCKARGDSRIILDRDGKEPYLERFYPINRLWTLGLVRIFIHRFWRSDDDANHYHTHPWIIWGTLILKGGYIEHTPGGDFNRKPGDFAIKTGWASHYVELHKDKSGKEQQCWTLFFVFPKIKTWHFVHPVTGAKTHWKRFLQKKLERNNTK